MKWFRNRCARRRESLCLLAAGALPESQARELEAHVAECAGCRQYLAGMKNVAAPLAGWESAFSEVEPPPAAQRNWLKAIEATAAPPATRESAPLFFFAKLWFELVFPARRTWAGLAAVWVALVVFNFAQSDRRDRVIARTSVPVAEARLTFQEQQRLLAELLGSPPAAAPAEPPRRSPQPRSDRRDDFMMA